MPFLARAWQQLTGPQSQFELTTRIFHSVCLIIIVALAYNVPLNYYLGLYHISLLSAVSLMLFTITYFLSRFNNYTPLALLICCITGDLLFIVNFFLNSGIDGPTNLFFILTVVVMAAVIPVKRYWLLTISNFIIVLALLAIQFYYPELVPYTYKSNEYRFLDTSSAYVVVVGLTSLSFYFIRHNYDVEKQSSEQKAAMMKLLNEEKNKLFSIISHDLRAPLSNVQNYLELLSELEISESERRDIRKKLLDSTRYTLEMVNNVLSWSQSQMNGLKFKLTTLSVNDVLISQLLLFTNIAANKNIKVEISIDHDLKIWGNEGMLQLVARNLVNNAIKFTSPGGRIIFSARQQSKFCLIIVKDSGIGKPVKLHNNIFYLNAGTTVGTANEKGVGLGLVLCKEFTEAQQGRIWFECDSVSGTTFFVELPLDKSGG